MPPISEARDTLFLLTAGFEDPAFPGERFYCWHCALLEGLLTSFPDLATKLDVRRVAWPRPRATVIEAVGEPNQSLPVLLLAKGSSTELATGSHHGRHFVAGSDEISRALHVRHGFPRQHP